MRHDAACVENVSRVGDGQRILHVLLDQHGRNALATQFDDHPQRFLRHTRAQSEAWSSRTSNFGSDSNCRRVQSTLPEASATRYPDDLRGSVRSLFMGCHMPRSSRRHCCSNREIELCESPRGIGDCCAEPQ
jgi:hypothetical protein